jgi:excisionase family DNA binding protein
MVAPLIQLPGHGPADGWLNTKQTAEYVGMTVLAFQKHANAREMRFEQDCPGGKRWFKREDLDSWRRVAR